MKLQGVRVVDLSVFLPGPYLTMSLADHGAQVIKVEAPGGDPGRQIGPRQDGNAVFFRTMNRGKKSVVLDLKSEDGKAALRELCRTADVFVESFRPGVMKRLGFDADTVRTLNPRIVYASISAFGQDGPLRDVPAHDLAVQAMAGSLSLNRGGDGNPAIPGIPAADMMASLQGLSAVLMALYRREKTGRGDQIDIAMHDVALAAYPNQLGPALSERCEPVNAEERSLGGAAFYRVYSTRDGRHVVLGGQEPKFVRTLLGALGRPDLVELAARGPGSHQEPLADFLKETFMTRTRDEWVAWFAGRDVCFAPVNGTREALDNPQARHRGMILFDEMGQEHLGAPIRFVDEPAQPDLRVPQIGEHSSEIMTAAQGMRKELST